jgi:hypothetical protein
MTLPLEDNFNDIIGKAIRGLKLTPNEVATRAGALPEQVQALSEGVFDESVARKVAPVLELGPESLVAAGQKRYRPRRSASMASHSSRRPSTISPVNAYLVWDPRSRIAAAFDTGADASAMLELADERKLTIKLILITHTHGDHIFDLDRLKSKTGARAFVPDGSQSMARNHLPQAAHSRSVTCALRVD